MRNHHVRVMWAGRLIALGLLTIVSAAPCQAQPGQVVGWGNSFGSRYNPQPSRECMAICAGGYHSLALTADGTLMAWGENTVGQCNIPFGNNFAAIAAGHYHNLALKTDGTVVAWGDNTRGQCNVPRDTRFRAIAAGAWHSLGIRLDGTLVAWGWNEQHQCDVPAGNDYTEAAGGYSHSLALKTDGSVVAWGANGDGQTNVPQGVQFTQIAAGTLHNLALKADGSLVAWGRNGEGQCRIPSGKDFVAVAAGSLHSLALRRDGRIESWGQDNYAQCEVPEGDHFAVIAAGDFHSLAIRDLRKRSLETQVTSGTGARDPAQARTAVPIAGEQATGPTLGDLVVAGEVRDANAIATEKLLSNLERKQPVPVKPIEPLTAKDPNAGPPAVANAARSQVAQEPNEVKPAVVAAAPSVDPNAASKQPAKPPVAAAEPNKPVLDLESPANQGYAPSIYMGVIENASPVYHFVSTTSKRHFCTIDEQEKYKLLDQQPSVWKYQGIAFFAYAEGHQPKDARPVYRFWSDSLSQYFYTMDESTKDLLIEELASVWKYEGVAWYAPAIKKPEQKK
ncbi:MAG: hypothetical protein KBE65_03250 [Phycisphaerae bacterium]|nr:hypothetical protein [Phycisphaerae bacterium]